MRRFQIRSLLIERVNIRMPGLCIHTFALHRHLREHAAVDPTTTCGARPFSTSMDEEPRSSGRTQPPFLRGLWSSFRGLGTLFRAIVERTPQCLMINFRLRGERSQPRAVCSVNRSELAQVRQRLADLLRLQSGAGGALHWESSITILQLLVSLLRLAGWLERADLPPETPGDRQSGACWGHGPRKSSEAVGPPKRVQPRPLEPSRSKETGLTLGQLRNQRRLAKAKKLLSAGVQVGNVAAAVGMLDQSYFARWFRRQTGEAPSRWTPRRSV